MQRKSKIISVLAVFMMVVMTFTVITSITSSEDVCADGDTTTRYYWDFTDDDAYTNDGKTISTRTGTGYDSNTATYVTTSGTFTDTHNSSVGLIRSDTHTYYNIGTPIVLKKNEYWSVEFKITDRYMIDGYYSGFLLGGSSGAYGIWSQWSANNIIADLDLTNSTLGNNTRIFLPVSFNTTDDAIVKIVNLGDGTTRPTATVTLNGTTYSDIVTTEDLTDWTYTTLSNMFGKFDGGNSYCFNGEISYIDVQLGGQAPVTNYTVSFVSNNSEYGSVSPSSVTVPSGTSIFVNGNVITIGTNTITATPSADTPQWVYSFGSWSGTAQSVSGDMTITANFLRSEAGTHTVTFDSNGGTPTYQSQTIQHGEYATRPSTDPEKTDYEFAGWYNGNTLFDFVNTPITQNITLTARWTYDGPGIALSYDDRYDVSSLGQPTSITGTATSSKVGTDTPDDAILVYSNGKLIAVGTGTATVTWSGGETRTFIVSPAHISMFYIIGHSFGFGQEGNASGSIKCADGTAYFSPTLSGSATGKGIGYGSASRLSVDNFTSGSGQQGEGSGVAYQWYKETGTKAWVITTAVSGTNINGWKQGGTQYTTAKTTYTLAQTVMDNEVDAGHYILDHIVMIYHGNANGDATFAISTYLEDFNSMWNGFKMDLSMEIGSATRTPEAIGLVPMISVVGYSSTKNYLELSNGEVCNYYLASSNDYPDVFLLSDLERIWLENNVASGSTYNPDVADYWSTAYPNGIDYQTHGTTYSTLPTTVNELYMGGGHFSQIAYNENGIVCAKAIKQFFDGNNVAEDVSFYKLDGRTEYTGTIIAQVGTPIIITPICEPYYANNLTYTVRGSNFTFSVPDTITPVSNGISYLDVYSGTELLDTFLVNVGNVAVYTVTFDSQGGTSVPAQNIQSGQTATQPTAPTKNGYTFNGWYNGSTEYVWSTPVTENITLTAHWDLVTYNVTYNTNGGSAITSGTYTIESADVILPTTSTKNGYTFGGWFDNEGLTGDAVVKISTGSTGDKVFYAKWDLVTYNITYNVNGGSAITSGTYTIESADIILPTTSTKNGYTFGGWFDNEDLTGDAVVKIAAGSTGDKVFYAKWDLVTYTIKYVVNGGETIADQKYTVETDKITLPTPVKNGYVFKGWYTDQGLTGTPVTEIAKGSVGDRTYYASWGAESNNDKNILDMPVVLVGIGVAIIGILAALFYDHRAVLVIIAGVIVAVIGYIL